jgi:amidase
MTLNRRDDFIRRWEDFFADHDALLVPVGTRTAERHGVEPAEISEEYPYALSQVSGCPMVVVPAGVDGRGLPFGLQVLGRRWEDERLLAISQLILELTTGYRRPPGY